MDFEDNVGDVTRESLIALSYTLPEKDAPDSLELQELEKTSNVDKDNAPIKKDSYGDGNGSEDYMSDLISLSYTSPDVDVEPLPEVKS